MRTRKCSIVQEEEDEDDVSSCSGRDEHSSNSALNSFNRRGSRSEGKLSHILQERLSQLPEKHTGTKPVQGQRHPHQKEDIVITDRGERLKQSSRNEKDNKKLSSPVHSKTTGKVQTGNVLLEKLPRITTTCEENLKNRLSDANAPTTGWSRKTNNTEVRPKSVTDCLNRTSGGSIPANKWRMGSQHHRFSVPLMEPTISSKPSQVPTKTIVTTTTTILLESSTVSIPLHPISDNQVTLTPKYKTMPSPSSGNSSTTQLNEILEDGDGMQASMNSTECGGSTTKCRVVRRTAYEQRRSKFHKTRTTSCSSSDASDDDSESRKKRAHKLGASTPGKPLPPRRDSHDDSSDSQDPGGSGGGRGGVVGGGGSGVSNGQHTTTNESNRSDNSSGTNTTNTNTTTTTGGGRHRCTENQVIFGRRHRAGRRRAGETRLRESQSLNRITEVQEAEAPSSCQNHCHVSRNSTAVGTPNVSSSMSQSNTASQQNAAQPVSQVAATTVQKAKGLGARLLQSWSLAAGKSLISQSSNKQSAHSPGGKSNNHRQSDNCCQTISNASDERRGDHKCTNQATCNDKENRGNGSINRNECKSRKIRLLSRYFAVHKKLCVPLPGFGKGRLYKARSCGSITRDRVSPPSPKSMLFCSTAAAEDKWRERRQWCDAATKQHRGSDGDINQNLGLAHLVQESIVGKGCTKLPAVCHIHLGDASKCCSLC